MTSPLRLRLANLRMASGNVSSDRLLVGAMEELTGRGVGNA
jgi:hypothetical protein